MIKPLQPRLWREGKQANLATLVEMHPYPRLRRYFLRRGKSALRFPVESCGTMLSTHSPTAKRGEGGGASHQRGRRPQAAFILEPQGAHHRKHMAHCWTPIVPPRSGGKVVALATKGGAAERRHTKWRRKAPYLPSGAVLYNYPGRSPQTACKAQPFTGRTLAAQGRKPRRLPQPSARRAVNLREYSQAPPSLPKTHSIKSYTQQKSTNLSTSAFSS